MGMPLNIYPETAMNLDDLKNAWAARDKKLEESIRLNTRLLRESFLDKHRESIRKRGPFGAFEMGVWIASVILLGAFLAAHYGEMKFFIPALFLDGWVIVMGILGIRQRMALHEIDYGQPLLAVQKQFETLKIARMRTFQWAFLTGQVLWWIPFTIVLFKGMLGVDLYSVNAFMPWFIACNIVGGLLFIPLAIWGSRRLAPRLQRSTVFQRLTDRVAGRDIAAARTFLKELARFEQDTPRTLAGA